MNYSNTLVVKVPDEIANRLMAAAKAQVMTKSEYVRRALMEKLERDGFWPHSFLGPKHGNRDN